MLAPNGQTFFPSCDDWEATYTVARDVLGRCTDHFECAVEGKFLVFKLHPGDSAVLEALYSEYTGLITGQFYLFANQVLDMMRMPYRLSSVKCLVANPVTLYCSVRRETFNDIKMRMGEA